MKLFKRLSAFILSCALALMITPAKVQAQDFSSAKVEEALAFIQGKGFMVGTVLSSSVEGDKITLEVSYIADEVSTLIYEKLDNGDVVLTIIESLSSDVILFKVNGDVYIDNVFDQLLTQYYAVSSSNTSRGYISVFYSTMPSGWPNNLSFSGPAQTNWYVNFGGVVKGYTVSYIANIISIQVCQNSDLANHFSSLASTVLGLLIAINSPVTGLLFKMKTYTDSQYAPSSYYNYHLVYISVSDNEPYGDCYSHKILI